MQINFKQEYTPIILISVVLAATLVFTGYSVYSDIIAHKSEQLNKQSTLSNKPSTTASASAANSSRSDYQNIDQDLKSFNPSPTPSSGTYKLNIYSLFPNGQLVSLLSAANLIVSNSFGEQSPVEDQDGNLYYYDREKVYMLPKGEYSPNVVYKVTNSDKDIIRVTISSQTPKVIYVVESPSNYYGREEGLSIFEKNISTSSIRKIGPIQPVFYGGLEYLFKSTGSADIVASFGGDSCKGWGTISKVLNNAPKDIVKTGVGCSDDPRYITYFPTANSLILAQVKKVAGDDNFADHFQKVYLQNVDSNKTADLMDLSTYPDIQNISFNQAHDKLFLSSDSTAYIYDLIHKKIEKTVNLKSKIGYVNNFDDTSAYAYNYEDKSINILDLQTGEVRHVSVAGIFGQKQLGTVSIIGTYQGKLAVSITQGSN